jgi:hypothetical protein
MNDVTGFITATIENKQNVTILKQAVSADNGVTQKLTVTQLVKKLPAFCGT